MIQPEEVASMGSTMGSAHSLVRFPTRFRTELWVYPFADRVSADTGTAGHLWPPVEELDSGHGEPLPLFAPSRRARRSRTVWRQCTGWRGRAASLLLP